MWLDLHPLNYINFLCISVRHKVPPIRIGSLKRTQFRNLVSLCV
jgi:hypothetical protein